MGLGLGLGLGLGSGSGLGLGRLPLLLGRVLVAELRALALELGLASVSARVKGQG